MKKTLIVLLATVFVLSLCACDNDNALSQRKQTHISSTITSTDSTSQASGLNGGTQNSSAADKTSVKDALIDRDSAINIALKKADVERREVYDLEIEFDNDDKIAHWEVEFEAKGISFSYDIDANTGKILKSEKDFDD